MVLDVGENKSKNRRRLDIVRDMLSVALVKVRKTKIMYQASLNYRQVEKYLQSLLDSGLVEYDGNFSYLITLRGREFLQMYSDYLERIRQIDEDIDVVRKDKLLLENMCFNCDAIRTHANRKRDSE